MSNTSRTGFAHTQTVLFEETIARLFGGEHPQVEEAITDGELKAFLASRIEQVQKKNSAVRKPTPQQVQNEAFAADILAWMEQGKEYSLADIHKGVPSVVASGISPNRVVGCLTKLKNTGKLSYRTEKGKSYYALA